MTADVLKTHLNYAHQAYIISDVKVARVFFPVSPSCAQLYTEDPGEEMDGLRGTHTTHGEANAQENPGAKELMGLTRKAKHVRNVHGYLIPGGNRHLCQHNQHLEHPQKPRSNGWENTDTLAYSRFVALQHKKRRNL